MRAIAPRVGDSRRHGNRTSKTLRASAAAFKMAAARRRAGLGQDKTHLDFARPALIARAEILLDHRAGFRCGRVLTAHRGQFPVRIFIDTLGLRVHERHLNAVNVSRFFRGAA
jgi:hypothetical protein